MQEIVKKLTSLKFEGEAPSLESIRSLFQRTLEIEQKNGYYQFVRKRMVNLSRNFPSAVLRKDYFSINKIAYDKIFTSGYRFSIIKQSQGTITIDPTGSDFCFIPERGHYFCYDKGLMAYIKTLTKESYFFVEGKKIIL